MGLIEAQVEAQGFMALLANAPATAKQQIQDALEDTHREMVPKVTRDMKRAAPVLLGNLARSLSGVVESWKRARWGTLGKRVAYALIQERGGVIRPKKANRLWIPIGEAKTAAGAPRFSPTDLMGDPESLGFKSSGIGLWAGKGKKVATDTAFGFTADGKAQGLFKLVREVRIQAANAGHGYAMFSLEKRLDEYNQSAAARIENALAGVRGF